jgi:hypothetical protein
VQRLEEERGERRRPDVKRLFFVIPVFLCGLAVLLYVGLFQGPPSELPSPLVGKARPAIALPRSTSRAPVFAAANSRRQAGDREFLGFVVRPVPA